MKGQAKSYRQMQCSGVWLLCLLVFVCSLGIHRGAVAADGGAVDPSAASSRQSKLIAVGQTARRPSPANLPNISPTGAKPATQIDAPAPTIPSPTDVNTPAQLPEKPLDVEFNSPVAEPGKNNSPVNSAAVEYDAAALAEPLPLAHAMSEAMRVGPRAAAIRAQLGITQAGLSTATQAPNPTTFMDRGMMAEQVMRIGPIFETDMPWELYLRLLAAKLLVNQTKVDLMTQIWSLRTDVRHAYVELVVAQETQRTLVQLYELADRLYVVSKKRYEAGAVPELDVLKGHLLASQSSVDVGVGIRRIAVAKQQLNILMGRPINSPLYVAPLPDYTSSKEALERLRVQKSDILPNFNEDIAPLNLFVAKGIQSRLELKSLGLQLKVNTANARLNYANIIPNPNFALGKDTAGNEPSGPKITAVFMTLNQETPLTNINQGQIYQYKATGYQLNYQTAAQRNIVNSDISGAYQNVLAARDKVRIYQERLLRDSNEVTRLAYRSYEAGQSDMTAALQAQQANIQVRSSYLDAINSYASAFADLEKAVGRPLQ